MRRHPRDRFLKQGTSLVVCFSFLLTHVTPSFAFLVAADGFSEIGRLQASHAIHRDSLDSRQSIPFELGSIQSNFIGKNKGTVYLIQDAHANEEAQRKISGLIEFLHKTKNVRSVAIEGASGDLDTLLFGAFPNAQAREWLGDYYLKEGKITGAGYAALVKIPELRLIGVEEPHLYEESRQAFLHALKVNHHALKTVEGLETSLNQAARFVYSEELRRLLTTERNFKSDRSTLTSFVRQLTQFARMKHIRLTAYPTIQNLLRLVSLEKRIDFAKAEVELKNLTQKLEASLNAGERFRFSQETINWKLGKVSHANYYGFLYAGIKKMKKSSDGSLDGVLRFLKYQRLISSLSPKLFEEIDALTSEIKVRLFENDSQRTLNQFFQKTALLKRAFSFSLIAKDASQLLADAAPLDVEFLSAFLRHSEQEFGQTFSFPKDVLMLEKEFGGVRKFYELAVARDKILIEHTLEALQRESGESIILVAGGFHTPGVADFLKKKSISCVVITPRIQNPIQEALEAKKYKESIEMKPTKLEALLSQMSKKASSRKLEDPQYQLGIPNRIFPDGSVTINQISDESGFLLFLPQLLPLDSSHPLPPDGSSLIAAIQRNYLEHQGGDVKHLQYYKRLKLQFFKPNSQKTSGTEPALFLTTEGTGYRNTIFGTRVNHGEVGVWERRGHMLQRLPATDSNFEIVIGTIPKTLIPNESTVIRLVPNAPSFHSELREDSDSTDLAELKQFLIDRGQTPDPHANLEELTAEVASIRANEAQRKSTAESIVQKWKIYFPGSELPPDVKVLENPEQASSTSKKINEQQKKFETEGRKLVQEIQNKFTSVTIMPVSIWTWSQYEIVKNTHTQGTKILNERVTAIQKRLEELSAKDESDKIQENKIDLSTEPKVDDYKKTVLRGLEEKFNQSKAQIFSEVDFFNVPVRSRSAKVEAGDQDSVPHLDDVHDAMTLAQITAAVKKQRDEYEKLWDSTQTILSDLEEPNLLSKNEKLKMNRRALNVFIETTLKNLIDAFELKKAHVLKEAIDAGETTITSETMGRIKTKKDLLSVVQKVEQAKQKLKSDVLEIKRRLIKVKALDEWEKIEKHEVDLSARKLVDAYIVNQLIPIEFDALWDSAQKRLVDLNKQTELSGDKKSQMTYQKLLSFVESELSKFNQQFDERKNEILKRAIKSGEKSITEDSMKSITTESDLRKVEAKVATQETYFASYRTEVEIRRNKMKDEETKLEYGIHDPETFDGLHGFNIEVLQPEEKKFREKVSSLILNWVKSGREGCPTPESITTKKTFKLYETLLRNQIGNVETEIGNLLVRLVNAGIVSLDGHDGQFDDPKEVVNGLFAGLVIDSAGSQLLGRLVDHRLTALNGKVTTLNELVSGLPDFFLPEQVSDFPAHDYLLVEAAKAWKTRALLASREPENPGNEIRTELRNNHESTEIKSASLQREVTSGDSGRRQSRTGGHDDDFILDLFRNAQESGLNFSNLMEQYEGDVPMIARVIAAQAEGKSVSEITPSVTQGVDQQEAKRIHLQFQKLGKPFKAAIATPGMFDIALKQLEREEAAHIQRIHKLDEKALTLPKGLVNSEQFDLTIAAGGDAYEAAINEQIALQAKVKVLDGINKSLGERFSVRRAALIQTESELAHYQEAIQIAKNNFATWAQELVGLANAFGVQSIPANLLENYSIADEFYLAVRQDILDLRDELFAFDKPLVENPTAAEIQEELGVLKDEQEKLAALAKERIRYARDEINMQDLPKITVFTTPRSLEKFNRRILEEEDSIQGDASILIQELKNNFEVNWNEPVRTSRKFGELELLLKNERTALNEKVEALYLRAENMDYVIARASIKSKRKFKEIEAEVIVLENTFKTDLYAFQAELSGYGYTFTQPITKKKVLDDLKVAFDKLKILLHDAFRIHRITLTVVHYVNQLYGKATTQSFIDALVANIDGSLPAEQKAKNAQITALQAELVLHGITIPKVIKVPQDANVLQEIADAQVLAREIEEAKKWLQFFELEGQMQITNQETLHRAQDALTIVQTNYNLDLATLKIEAAELELDISPLIGIKSAAANLAAIKHAISEAKKPLPLLTDKSEMQNRAALLNEIIKELRKLGVGYKSEEAETVHIQPDKLERVRLAVIKALSDFGVRLEVQEKIPANTADDARLRVYFEKLKRVYEEIETKKKTAEKQALEEASRKKAAEAAALLPKRDALPLADELSADLSGSNTPTLNVQPDNSTTNAPTDPSKPMSSQGELGARKKLFEENLLPRAKRFGITIDDKALNQYLTGDDEQIERLTIRLRTLELNSIASRFGVSPRGRIPTSKSELETYEGELKAKGFAETELSVHLTSMDGTHATKLVIPAKQVNSKTVKPLELTFSQKMLRLVGEKFTHLMLEEYSPKELTRRTMILMIDKGQYDLNNPNHIKELSRKVNDAITKDIEHLRKVAAANFLEIPDEFPTFEAYLEKKHELGRETMRAIRANADPSVNLRDRNERGELRNLQLNDFKIQTKLQAAIDAKEKLAFQKVLNQWTASPDFQRSSRTLERELIRLAREFGGQFEASQNNATQVLLSLWGSGYTNVQLEALLAKLPKNAVIVFAVTDSNKMYAGNALAQLSPANQARVRLSNLGIASLITKYSNGATNHAAQFAVPDLMFNSNRFLPLFMMAGAELLSQWPDVVAILPQSQKRANVKVLTIAESWFMEFVERMESNQVQERHRKIAA